MKTPIAVLLLAIAGVSAAGAEGAPAQTADPALPVVGAAGGKADGVQLEKALQRLPWRQFKSVVEAVPKLRAGVEAFGPVGWQIVRDNYTRYPWHKNIDKLDEVQKKQLSELIEAAQAEK